MKLINLDKIVVADKAEGCVWYKNVKFEKIQPEEIKYLNVLKERIKREMAPQVEAIIKEKGNESVIFSFVFENSFEVEEFYYVTNIVVALFADMIVTQEKREREWRLGIPTAFKDVYLSVSTLKKMVNYKTKINMFNITIKDGGVNRYNMLGDE